MAKWHRLTDSELELLSILWKEGPATVKAIAEKLPEKGYTTVLKLLQLMHEKGLVTREESARAHVYAAAIAAEQTQRNIVRDVVSRVFNGSSKALALNALGAQYSEEQLAEIRKLLDQMEEK